MGSLAPFYVSRWRLQLLAQRLAASWKGTLSGKIAIPGVGEFTLNRDGQAPGTLGQLERVLTSLTRSGAIGDAWDADVSYTWVHVTSNISRLRLASDIDHLVIADSHSVVPLNWHVFLAGVRANLVSLDPATATPEFGSSPLALQAVLGEVLAADSRASSTTSRPPRAEMTTRLIAACRSLADEQPRFGISGVVEVVYRDPDHHVLLGSPLFLSTFSR